MVSTLDTAISALAALARAADFETRLAMGAALEVWRRSSSMRITFSACTGNKAGVGKIAAVPTWCVAALVLVVVEVVAAVLFSAGIDESCAGTSVTMVIVD